MTSPYWPLSGLRLRTPDLELHWPAPADLDALAGLAAQGVHEPAVQPFAVAWTDVPPAELHLAFEGLGAQTATSGAYTDNQASLAVSAKLGYTSDGSERHTIRGQLALLHRLRLDQETWQALRSIPVQIEGLTPCLPSFGLAS
jgi:hypothetical protein